LKGPNNRSTLAERRAKRILVDLPCNVRNKDFQIWTRILEVKRIRRQLRQLKRLII